MVNLKEASGLVLAYLGDAVWELNVREYIIEKGYNNNKSNKAAKELVNAKIQSQLFKKMHENLSEEEKEIVRRAKNSNIKSFPKSCSIIEYKEATAFEAMIAIFYTKGEFERIKNTVKMCEELLK